MGSARSATGIEESLKRLEARLESRLTAMSRQLKPVTVVGGGGNESLQRQDFMAAALRLPDGDPWKEKVMKELQVTSSHQENNRQWVHKSNTDNFRRWLLAPEGAGPFDFTKIFKGFGYSIDVTHRNLPPAVPCM